MIFSENRSILKCLDEMMFDKYNLLTMVKSVTVKTPTKAILYICHHHIQSRLFPQHLKVEIKRKQWHFSKKACTWQRTIFCRWCPFWIQMKYISCLSIPSFNMILKCNKIASDSIHLLHLLWKRFSPVIAVPTGSSAGILSCASYQIRKIAGCACAGNARNVFPATDFKGNC